MKLKEDILKTLIVFCCVLVFIIIFLSSCGHKDTTDWVGVTNYIKDKNE